MSVLNQTLIDIYRLLKDVNPSMISHISAHLDRAAAWHNLSADAWLDRLTNESFENGLDMEFPWILIAKPDFAKKLMDKLNWQQSGAALEIVNRFVENYGLSSHLSYDQAVYGIMVVLVAKHLQGKSHFDQDLAGIREHGRDGRYDEQINRFWHATSYDNNLVVFEQDNTIWLMSQREMLERCITAVYTYNSPLSSLLKAARIQLPPLPDINHGDPRFHLMAYTAPNQNHTRYQMLYLAELTAAR